MKKIPMFLSTVTVVAGLGTQLLMPGVVALDSAADSDISMLTLAEDVGYVHSEGVYVSRRQVNIQTWLKSGWFTKRVVISGLDYENGFTEADAEAGWSSINSEKADWELRFADFNAEGSPNILLPLRNGGFSANKTGVLYYAVLVGSGVQNGTDVEWGEEEVWLRGKLDYRSCAALSVFNSDTMYCSNVAAHQSTPTYVPRLTATGETVQFEKDEQIRSWAEEWRGIQEKRLGDTRNDMGNLERYLTMAVYMMDMADSTLEGLRKTLPNTEWADEMTMSQLQQVEQMVAYLRDYYNNLNASEFKKTQQELEAKIRELETEKESLTTQLVLEQENREKELNMVKMELSQSKDENEALHSEIERLRAEKKELEQGIGNCSNSGDNGTMGDNDEAGGSMDDNGTNNGAGNGTALKQDVTDITVSTSNVASEGSSEVSEGLLGQNVGSIAENEQNAVEGQLGGNGAKSEDFLPTETDVELPKLGERSFRAWWWLLIPILVCLGSLGLWLKRAFCTKKKR